MKLLKSVSVDGQKNKMPLNKLQKVVADFTRKQDKAFRVVSDDLLKKIGTKTDPGEVSGIIKDVFSKHGVKRDLYDDFMGNLIRSVEVGAGTQLKGVNSFKRWYTENATSIEGVSFSERVNDLFRTPEIITDIRTSLKNGRSWRAAAQQLQERGIQNADVAKDIRELMDEAKKVFRYTDDSAAYTEYKAKVMQVQRRIDGLVKPDKSTLKRAYQNILDITNKSSSAQIESAIKYASYYKQRYNAERIARTEYARAYGDAAISEAWYDEDVIGIRFMLSSGHPETDICDYHTGVDLYGMGDGVYPKNRLPEYPFHPHCLCSMVEVYEGEAKKGAYDHDAGKRYLKSLSKGDQENILGVSGRDAFMKKPDKWASYVKQYSKPELITKAPIPEKVLHG
jgi:hypothetical protein